MDMIAAEVSIGLEEVRSLTSYPEALSLIVSHENWAGSVKLLADKDNLICFPLKCQLQPRKAAFQSRS